MSESVCQDRGVKTVRARFIKTLEHKPVEMVALNREKDN
jgi:hypothetical protein